MQRRLYLAPLRHDRPREELVAHWLDRHGAIFAATPLLQGYVQNPLAEPVQGLWRTVVCSETWFASQAQEREGFQSSYYLRTVVPDEERFLDRDHGWGARVVSRRSLTAATEPRSRQGEAVGSSAWRVLALGIPWDFELPPGIDCQAELLALDRPAPVWAAPAWNAPTVLSVSFDSRPDADRLAGHLGPLAVVCSPVMVVEPPA